MNKWHSAISPQGRKKFAQILFVHGVAQVRAMQFHFVRPRIPFRFWRRLRNRYALEQRENPALFGLVGARMTFASAVVRH